MLDRGQQGHYIQRVHSQVLSQIGFELYIIHINYFEVSDQTKNSRFNFVPLDKGYIVRMFLEVRMLLSSMIEVGLSEKSSE